MKNRGKNEKGSMLIGVLVVMIMVAGISLAIIRRATVGAVITTDSRKSYRAYQDSDTETEKVLNSFKLLDDNKFSLGEIPQNKPATDYGFCSSGVECYKSNGDAVSNSDKVSDIDRVEQVGDEGSLKRSINVPVPSRIPNAVTDLKVEKCGNGIGSCTYNECDVLVSWKKPADASYSAGYEIRRSISKDLKNASYGWQLPPKYLSGVSNPIEDVNTESILVKNNEDNGLPGGKQKDKTYYYSIKLKNKNNFSLDSFYQDPNGNSNSGVTMGANRCEDAGTGVLSGLGCTIPGTNPEGTRTATVAYNCCDGTECYEPDPDWEPDPEKKCALEKCKSGDDASWCKTAQSCQEGGSLSSDPCDLPHKTLGYCLSKPDDSAYTTFFNNSSWALSNYSKVYTGLDDNPDPPGLKPRCSKHLCPTDGSVNSASKCGTLPAHGDHWTNNSSCSENPSCGEYSYNINCSLTCQNGWEANSNPSNPSGACCYHQCSQWVNPGCPSDPANGHYTNSQYCSASSCGEFTTQGTCTLNCNSGYHQEGGSCVSDTRDVACSPANPTNSTWSAGSTCHQTWSNGAWSPACPSTHNGTDACGYTCTSGMVAYGGIDCRYYHCNKCSSTRGIREYYYSSSNACSDQRAISTSSDSSCAGATSPVCDSC